MKATRLLDRRKFQYRNTWAEAGGLTFVVVIQKLRVDRANKIEEL